MKHEIGLSHDIFGERPPLEDDFAILADAGIRHTQVWVWDNRIEPGDFAMVDKVLKWAGRNGVNIESVHGPSGYPTVRHWLADPDPEARKWAVEQRRLALQTAARLGAGYMVVEYEIYDRWPFWPHQNPVETSYTDSARLFEESFDQVAKEAVVQGVRIALENVDGVSVESQREFLAKYDPAVVGVCFDSCHTTYEGDFFEQLDTLLPRLISTHLSDNDALDGINWKDRHWPPFKGVIDWPRLIERIIIAPELAVIMVECMCPENTITPDVVDSLRRLEGLVRESA